MGYSDTTDYTNDTENGQTPQEQYMGVPLIHASEVHTPRWSNGSKDLDQFFGGPMPISTLLLLAGVPGSGKSTFALQWCNQVAQAHQSENVIYATAEERGYQIVERARRINASCPNVRLVATENYLTLATQIERLQAKFAVIDSLQVLHHPRCKKSEKDVFITKELRALCQRTGCVIVLIAHVNKEEAIAGPKQVEHLVDVVLYMEKEGEFRWLRPQKSRIGPTYNTLALRMEEDGLRVCDERLRFTPNLANTPGACLSVFSKKNREYLVEVQALVSTPKKKGRTKQAKGTRSVVGFAPERLAMIEAILARHGLDLEQTTIYLAVQSGIVADTHEIDLAVASALVSSYFDKRPISFLQPDKKAVFLGEIGLDGSIKTPSSLKEKLSISQQLSVDTIGNFPQGLQISHIRNLLE